MDRSNQMNKLDLLHKGIYPAIAIVVTLSGVLFAAYVFRTNNDKQRQLDTLQAELQAIKDEKEAVEARRKEQVSQSEEREHRLRVEICKGLRIDRISHRKNDPELQVQSEIRVWFALRIASLQRQDAVFYGEDKAKEYWDRALKQSEKEVKPKELDWSF